jgi:hypothetical protein
VLAVCACVSVQVLGAIRTDMVSGTNRRVAQPPEGSTF